MIIKCCLSRENHQLRFVSHSGILWPVLDITVLCPQSCVNRLFSDLWQMVSTCRRLANHNSRSWVWLMLEKKSNLRFTPPFSIIKTLGSLPVCHTSEAKDSIRETDQYVTEGISVHVCVFDCIHQSQGWRGDDRLKLLCSQYWFSPTECEQIPLGQMLTLGQWYCGETPSTVACVWIFKCFLKHA